MHVLISPVILYFGTLAAVLGTADKSGAANSYADFIDDLRQSGAPAAGLTPDMTEVPATTKMRKA